MNLSKKVGNESQIGAQESNKRSLEMLRILEGLKLTEVYDDSNQKHKKKKRKGKNGNESDDPNVHDGLVVDYSKFS
eukprot:CAMPEP_0185577042 /NCGR_PEP_ID=MMETSP0434-20130131/7842_1 /TAXON_ID=626734 ORGANISM="Favella taraikaensis, Strain Fe Narragansett Bay" /NCGR_SAMPLE_ID=MMETSP0434 /ASSEMBLY_ACC=CAM_ASM_000379 /LENGTH=75 /DNA_ID=CAMNT_0028194497 /DNA_START=431 /DNA_END=658 /DNA_ORIENTATION=+